MFETNQTNRILAITVGSFPFGGAWTNRQLSYLRGLSEMGKAVQIFVLSPDRMQSVKSNKRNIVYNKINICYTCPFLYPKNRIAFLLNYLLGIIRGILKLISTSAKNKEQHTLLFAFTSPVLLYIFLKLGHILRHIVIHERAEFPFLNQESSWTIGFYLKRIIPQFDGMFVINKALADYFKRFTAKEILVLPMSVEIDRFDDLKKSGIERYIAYCGSMYTDKDGILDLIEAYDIVARNIRNIKLYLIGDNSDRNKFKIIQDKINQSNYHDRILCTGYIERDEMPKLLFNAELLALARPNNVQAKGGFPTKLGEYLATGNPVVITDVGEHKTYLQDGITAFISPPGNPVAFAKKMLEALSNKERAMTIGESGKEVAIENFDYKKVAIKLNNYIENIFI